MLKQGSSDPTSPRREASLFDLPGSSEPGLFFWGRPAPCLPVAVVAGLQLSCLSVYLGDVIELANARLSLGPLHLSSSGLQHTARDHRRTPNRIRKADG